MDAKLAISARLRVLLVLGRVSNLPTVWSNCLAAWLLGGAGSWGRFAVLGIGASWLYIGGMFLNDAFDEKFDRQYRRERPIPAGQVEPRLVWLLGGTCLLLGWLLLCALGRRSALFGAVLTAAIVVYDAIHKRSAMAPILMSACRFLLYALAACAAHDGINAAVMWRAAALAGYISGLSFLARGESRQGAAPWWSIGLLFVPVPLAVLTGDRTLSLTWELAAMLSGWVLWCLRGPCLHPRRALSSGVAGLLAGIVLVDWLAAGGRGAAPSVFFGSLFLLALLLQRIAPAT